MARRVGIDRSLSIVHCLVHMLVYIQLMNTTKIIEVMETFGFTDGSRLAWVTYLIGTGIERRCIGVREVLSYGPSRAGGSI